MLWRYYSGGRTNDRDNVYFFYNSGSVYIYWYNQTIISVYYHWYRETIDTEYRCDYIWKIQIRKMWSLFWICMSLNRTNHESFPCFFINSFLFIHLRTHIPYILFQLYRVYFVQIVQQFVLFCITIVGSYTLVLDHCNNYYICMGALYSKRLLRYYITQ